MYKIDDIIFGLEKVCTQIKEKDIYRYLICIKNRKTDFKLYTTDYTRYIYYPNGHTRKLTNSVYKNVLYVVDMLNWILIYNHNQYGIDRIENITFEMCQDYINFYAIYGSFNRKRAPIKETIYAVRGYISQFLYGMKCAGINPIMNKHWLLKENHKSSRKNKSYIYELDKVHDSSKINDMERDILDEFIELSLTCARAYMPLMELPIAIQCYSGIREGETCNCRREDSIYGAGIIKEMVDGEVAGIIIDLNNEYLLRSDRIQIGHIKKIRYARIYKDFINDFLDVYYRHLDLVSRLKTEKTGPLFVNERIDRKTGCHMAMSVASYRINYKKLVEKYMLPIMRKSDNSRLRNFAQLLDIRRYGQHWHRHWFSVQLVLAGVRWNILMELRGDSSPDSAIVYVNNKQKFRDIYAKANADLATNIKNYNLKENLEKDKSDENI